MERPESLRASVPSLTISHTPRSLPFVDNFSTDTQLSWPRPVSPSYGQKVLGGGGGEEEEIHKPVKTSC